MILLPVNSCFKIFHCENECLILKCICLSVFILIITLFDLFYNKTERTQIITEGALKTEPGWHKLSLLVQVSCANTTRMWILMCFVVVYLQKTSINVKNYYCKFVGQTSRVYLLFFLCVFIYFQTVSALY